MKALATTWQNILHRLNLIDFLAPFGFRLYLAPIFLAAGFTKLATFDATVNWFGNADWGLGLPFPWLLAILATATEIIGGFALVLGLAVRWFALPLMITMLVAAFAVHWENGWFAIAPGNPATSMAAVLAPVGFPGAEASLANSAEVGQRLSRIRSLLQEHGDYNWLTAKGNIVILNNGIEFSATYFLMLLSLLFTGAGRYVSLDYWFNRLIAKRE